MIVSDYLIFKQDTSLIGFGITFKIIGAFNRFGIGVFEEDFNEDFKYIFQIISIKKFNNTHNNNGTQEIQLVSLKTKNLFMVEIDLEEVNIHYFAYVCKKEIFINYIKPKL